MTPRQSLAAAAAALFLSAPALGALPEAPASCPFKFVPQDQKAEWIVPSKPECDFLMSLDDDFVRLSDAASFPRGKVSLSRMVLIQPYFNAYADAESNAVFINDMFVKKLMSDRPAAVWVLAHEVGHLVQYRDGEGVKRDEVWKSTGVGKAWNDFNRVFESQADRIGGELMARARFPIRAAAAVDAALGGRDMHLRSEHTHPANGIRWLEALKQQQALEEARYRASRQAVLRRSRMLMGKPAFDRDPDASRDNDNSTPMQWAATAKAAPYADKGKYAAGPKLEDFNPQGRLTAKKYPVFAVEVPPLSAAPGGARAQPGVEDLSLSDRLALRARTLGTPTSYAGAVWSGAYDWILDGGWWRKSENPAPTKPVAKARP